VLVVDDDPAIIEMFTELLERDGRFDVKTATTGYDAGILTEQFRPDVILLDYKLPDINGTVVCRTIRANPSYKHMQIIIISGVADPDEVADLKMAGADDFIRKPFDINEVIGRVANMLQVA
jgi:DNA-binding response OmpR family regulator